MVARIAARIFRLARVASIETGVLVWELHGDDAELHGDGGRDDPLRRLLMGFRHGSADTETVQRQGRSSDLARLGRAFIRDASGADALSKLSRYEARLDRALLRDLGELRRLGEDRVLEKPEELGP